MELLRLLDLKSGKAATTLGNYGKTAICIDLASDLYGIPFDMGTGLKACGLRKNVYTKYRRTFQKILDLNTAVDLMEMCKRFGRPELANKASEIIETYQKSVGEDLGTMDFSHPQYKTMAVYQAAKQENKRIQRSKIMPLSNLNYSQWCKLEENWDKVLANTAAAKASKRKSNEGSAYAEKKEKPAESETKSIENTTESYEVWKKRMITQAQLELKMSADAAEDKEN